MISRSQRIREYMNEALLSSFGDRVSEDEFNRFMHDVSIILLHSIVRRRNVSRLLDDLNALPITHDVKIYFEGIHSGPNEYFLFAEAGYNRRTDELIVWVNIDANRDALRSANPGDQLEQLRRLLLHELIHAEQFRRNRRHLHSEKSINTTYVFDPNFLKNYDLYRIQYGLRLRNKDNTEKLKLYRSVYTGNTKTARKLVGGKEYLPSDIDSWYLGQPEEIMGYAVQLGHSLAEIYRVSKRPESRGRQEQLNKKKVIFSLILFYVRNHIKVNVKIGEKSTAAYKRLLRHIAEYLVREEGIDPKDVSKLISEYFTLTAEDIRNIPM